MFEKIKELKNNKAEKNPETGLSRREFIKKSAMTFFALWFNSILTGCKKLSENEGVKRYEIKNELPEEVQMMPEEFIKNVELADGALWEIFYGQSYSHLSPKEKKELQEYEKMWKKLETFFKKDESEKLVKDLIFQSKTGKFLSLKQIAPPYTYFVFTNGSDFRTRGIKNKNKDRMRDSIVYNHPKLKEKGGLLALLHEIGHTYVNRSWPLEKIDLSSKIKFEFEKDVVGKNETLLYEFLQKYSARERSVVLQEERDAWARAIKILRELRRQGIDLAPGFTNEDIKNYIHRTPLKSYLILGIADSLLREFRREKRGSTLTDKELLDLIK